IRYRRLSLALRYLLYVVTQRPQLPLAALAESRSMALTGSASWISDLQYALQQLPVPVKFPIADALTPDTVKKCAQQVLQSLRSYLSNEVRGSERLRLLSARSHNLGIIARRKYLSLDSRALRQAICRLLASDHPFAIEGLRRRSPPIPREWRICRFCQGRNMVEDEAHVLMCCQADILRSLRAHFMRRVHNALTAHGRAISMSSPNRFLMAVIADECTQHIVAQFISDVFGCCDAVPLLVVTTMEQYQSYAIL
ncbi:uncharacterized protein B0H18DRAFT_1068269, partial [Fomitopsis serialis]|uniref:uncharacterized protein n=1 Tax=Fomitopsis serialis TaxID=139415 RepID=UPI002007CD26